MVKSSENPLVDIGSTTVSAFNIMKEQEKAGKEVILGVNETLKTTPYKKACVYVYTPQDKQKHRYFHSLSIDKQVEDFMGTAEMRCPYDSDLMEYWEPIRNYCIIYGSNKGEYDAKILFIGRVRGVKQEGYEFVVQFQDPYWKFKQLVTQSYANDNVLNKDGYTIMRLMLEALKFDSYVISESAKNRLKQVGFDQDGNLTINKKKLQYMPDLIKRLKKSDPSKLVSKDTIEDKLKESKKGNVKDINYTLKYEKPTKVMKKIASQGTGGYSPGKNIYSTDYGSKSSNTSSSSDGGSSQGSNQAKAPDNLCSSTVHSSTMQQAMKDVWYFQRGYYQSYNHATQAVTNYARNYPEAFFSKIVPCLRTLAKRPRDDGRNAAQDLINLGSGIANASKTSGNIARGIVNTGANIMRAAQSRYNKSKAKWNKGDYLGAAWTALTGR